MLRRATIRSLVVMLTLFVLIGAAQTPPPPSPTTTGVDLLAAQYTFRSIYLTYDTLTDIRNTLQVKATSPASFGDPEALTLLNTFIKANGGVRYADSAAFLQLNLQEEQAAFMPPGGRGCVTVLPWSRPQVRKVATLVHNYLLTNATANDIAATLQDQPLPFAFAEVQRLERNVLLSERSRHRVTEAFRNYMQRNSDELAALRATNTALAMEIGNFVEKLDEPPYTPLPSVIQASGNQFSSPDSPSITSFDMLLAPTYIKRFSDTDGWSMLTMTSAVTSTDVYANVQPDPFAHAPIELFDLQWHTSTASPDIEWTDTTGTTATTSTY